MESLLPEQINELHNVYNMLCKSPDGLLGHREVSQLLSGIGVKVTAQELKNIINDVVGEEPKIDFNAFVVLMTRKYSQLSFDDEINSLFKILDLNSDSVIDSSDLVSLMQRDGIYVTPGEAQALLSMISDSPQGLTEDDLKSFVHTKM